MWDHEDLQHLAIGWADETIRIGEILVTGPSNVHVQRRVLDEHFFLTSVTMLHRICKYLSKNSPISEVARAAAAFVVASKEAIEVRNKREHFDEYIDGNHKWQDQFTITKGPVRADLTSTQIDSRGYHLGHDACVQDLVAACIELKNHINPEW